MVKAESHESCSHDDGYPQFFKIYFPEQSSNRLRIPPAFLKNFKGVFPLKSTLESNGRSWCVDGNKVNSDFFLENGWPKFVQDNALNFGDFLVFSYVGDSLFSVSLYGPDCCRKKVPSTTIYQTTKAIKFEKMIKDGGSSEPAVFVSEHPFFQIVLQRAYLTHRYLRIPNAVRKHMKTNRSNCLFQFSDKSWPMNLTGFTKERVQVGGGLSKFWRDNNLKVGDLCTFELIDKKNYVFNVHIARR